MKVEEKDFNSDKVDLRRIRRKKAPRRKVNITLPVDLVEEVAFLIQSGEIASFSAFVEKLLRQELARRKKHQVQTAKA